MALKLHRRHPKECQGGHLEDSRSGEFEEVTARQEKVRLPHSRLCVLVAGPFRDTGVECDLHITILSQKRGLGTAGG